MIPSDDNTSLKRIFLHDEAKADHLLITGEGNFEGPMVEELFGRIMALSAQHQTSRVLIDVRKVKGSPTVMERFNVGTVFAEQYLQARTAGKIPACRFALVGEQPLVDPRRFGELVAVNRGAPIRVFTDEKEALAWLRED